MPDSSGGRFSFRGFPLAFLQREAVDLVIVDLLLEGELSGVDFANAARAFWPGPIVFHTLQ